MRTLILCCIFSGALSSFAATYYVDASRPDDTGVATNWAAAKKTIQAAVDLTQHGDTVLVTNGLYNTGGAVYPGTSLTNRVCVTNSVLIKSVNGPDFTIIQGAPGLTQPNDVDSVRGVFMGWGSSLIGFTVKDGHTMEWGNDVSDESGGGIWTQLGCLISNCVISANHSMGDGGGVLLSDHGDILDCTIISNSAEHGRGGGIWLAGNAERCDLIGNVAWNSAGGGAYLAAGAIRDSLVQGNKTLGYSGGGVHLDYGGLVEDSIISSNTADYGGGGVHVFYGGKISRCVIKNNIAGRRGGGGAELVGENCFMENCILDGNSTESRGGGVRLSMRALKVGEVNNCTIINNTAEAGGGAADGPLNNCIVWNNTATNSGPNVSGVTLKYSSCLDVVPGLNGNITNAPNFANPTIGDYLLLPGSPCINSGNNSFAPTGTDLAGSSRILGGMVDMGAYEHDIGLPTYQITTTTGSNGSIYPVNPIAYEGYDKSIYVFPDNGYQINTVTIDGTPVTPTNVHVFANILATHTISVTFSAISDTYYVDAAKPDNSGDGITWATAKKTIQAAVNIAGAGATVWVTDGIYDTDGKTTPGGATLSRVCVNDDIKVRSVNGPEATVIKGVQGITATRCVFLNNGAALDGFTITNGGTSSAGSTYDTSGGGILIGGSSIVSNCVITGNYTTFRGAGVFFNGGGTVNHCIISGNDSNQGGGGVYNSGGILNNCTIISNTAGYAGGGASIAGNGILNNCLLTGNSGASHSGGAYLYFGGSLNNCIVWNNTAPVTPNISTALTGNYIRNTCAQDGITPGANGCITNNPLFIDESSGNFELQYGSPCIDSGDNTYAPPFAEDLSGNLRIINGTVDMGAFEYNSATADSNQDGIPDSWYLSYGLDCTDPNIKNEDPDNDQQSTGDEFIAGYDPTNAASLFMITGFTNIPEQSIEWEGIPGRIYSVYWSTNLTDGFELIESNILWTVESFTDTVHSASSEGFYQLGVELQP